MKVSVGLQKTAPYANPCCMFIYMNRTPLDRIQIDMLRACEALERSDADLRADILGRWHWKQVFTAMSNLHRAGLITKFTGWSGELTEQGRTVLGAIERQQAASV